VKRFLAETLKPLRYINHEVNAFHKDFQQAKVRFCLIYPDVYEIGISHLGLKILYSILNQCPQYMADRAYTPWADMGEKLLSHGIPLTSIEANRPLKDFDCIGFTLQTELIYTNILHTLHLAQIPLHTADRHTTDPIILAGGINAVNPHPLSRFIDAFFIGEAEEGIIAIADIFHEVQGRDARLQALAELPYVYVPAYSGAKPIFAKKLVNFSESQQTHFPQLVPMLEGTHNRYVAEIMRGCTRGCRFCQAGMFYRPVREKDPNIIAKQLLEDVQASGWESAGLLSLSSTDYSCIKPLVEYLSTALKGTGTSLSLPSLRVDTLDKDMLGLMQELQTGGITLAPEAGTQRLRDIINKNITEEEILRAVQTAYIARAKLIKLYFMIGLPFETPDDVHGIVTLVEKIAVATHKKMRINVSISPFVPKPMTPFQWHKMDSEADVLDKALHIKHSLYKYKTVKVNYHTIESGYLEAVLGRGDSDAGQLIETAYRKGAKFDGWRECFNFTTWQNAVAETRFDWDKPIMGYQVEEALPWDNINIGVTKEFLLNEYIKAGKAATTADCREACAGCGLQCDLNPQFPSIRGVDAVGGRGVLANGLIHINETPHSHQPKHPVNLTVATPLIEENCPIYPFRSKLNNTTNQTYRITFSKINDLKYLSHLDFLRLIHRLLKLSGLPIAFSQGFNVHPKTSFCPPLSSGIEGLNEFFDVAMTNWCEPTQVLQCLAKTPIRDLTFTSATLHNKHTIPIKNYIAEVVSVTFESDVDIQQYINAFFADGNTTLQKEKKDGVRVIDLKDVILQIEAKANTVYITKKIAGASVFDILQKIWGINRENASGLRIARVAVIDN